MSPGGVQAYLSVQHSSHLHGSAEANIKCDRGFSQTCLTAAFKCKIFMTHCCTKSTTAHAAKQTAEGGGSFL